MGCAGAAAAASEKDALIAEALSAGPPVVTAGATVKDGSGNVLRKGTNDWTCYPGNPAIGPMCNRPQWDALIAALMKKEPFKATEFSVSYMLAGEPNTSGVSNSDPYAADPHAHGDYIKEGPHLMIIVPDPKALEGLSTNPADPVYVMWKGSPYAHIMVKIAPEPK
jgi:hypothetical protein